MGAALQVAGCFVEWFGIPFSADDINKYELRTGDHRCQQIAESLVMLVSLRAWRHRWCARRLQVCYVGDNKGVLRQLLAMRSKSAIQNSIVRELALDLCKGNYWPSNIESEFLRGSDNVVADMLSRRYQPGFVFHLPVCLVHAKEVKLERRDQSYYHL